tara:strand:+ start:404 stop:625 length:222 start_codon:yes stop_codon:yes gene_type:complete
MTNEEFKPLFTNLNLNPAREENESYDEYVIRRKKCNFILKKYKIVGRDVFENIFPEGITIEAMDSVINEAKES